MSFLDVDQTRHVFQAADYAVCGSMLLASLAIGFYYGLRGGRQRTSAEYVLANRRMTVVPVTLSLLATLFSGISLQGFPVDVYFRGTMFIWSIPAFFIGGVIAFYIFVPLFYNMGVSSVFEYLEARFNKAVACCGLFGFALFALLYMGLISFTACAATTAVTGLSFGIAVLCLVGICTIYTVIGGIKAVIWTDAIQMLLIFATIVVVIIKGSLEMGGIGNVWRIAQEGGRIQLLNISPDLTEYYTIWGFVIGQLGNLSTTVCNQYIIQRYVACKTLAVAKTALVFFMIGSGIFIALCVLGGVTLYAYYAGCDPNIRGILSQPDELLPYFVVEVFRGVPGMAGFLLSGVLGASLSTLSSAFNGMAILIGEHGVKQLCKNLTDEKYTLVLKVLVTFVAIITFGITFLIPLIGSAVPALLAIAGAVGGPLFGIYLLGALSPRCKAKGAFFGYVVGATVGIWLGIGNVIHGNRLAGLLPLSVDACPVPPTSNMSDVTLETMTTTFITADGPTTSLENSTFSPLPTDPVQQSGPILRPLYSVSRLWYPTITCLLTIVVAVVITLIFGGNDADTVDPRLYVQMPKWCHCAWPFGATVRKKSCDLQQAAKLEMKTTGTDPLFSESVGSPS